MAALSARYVETKGDIRQAQAKAALTPEERNELAGKK
jgi:hypothetical protein